MLAMGRQARRAPISSAAKSAIRATRTARAAASLDADRVEPRAITSPEHCDQNVISRSSLSQIGNELSTGAMLVEKPQAAHSHATFDRAQMLFRWPRLV